ncbi:MAG: hypothetical protein ABI205_08290 [Gemmatimonadaceae bacterium]
MNLPRQQADTTSARSVDGHVMRGTRQGPSPVLNQWVVLHRVGPDRAGPLDSVRTEAGGRYHIRYHTSGDTSALYFASTSYGGVAYFTSPLRAPAVKGDDALITVFDTTSGQVAIKLGGRHLIIGIPHPNGSRPVGEVYDLQNDSTVTVIARDSTTPVWLTHLPPGATAFTLNTHGDLAAGAVAQRGSIVGMFAPLSPGIRQLAYTYELPPSSFPLTIPIERPTGVFELLVQEPSARLSGFQMREMPPVTADGRLFRRFLAQDVPADGVITIDIPKLIGAERQKAYLGIGVVLLLLMLAALGYAARRSLPRLGFAGLRRGPTGPPEASPSDTLVRAIADLDANFEREPSPPPGARTAYENRRAKLKAELADVLAGGKRRT